jgi:hypothetical protein
MELSEFLAVAVGTATVLTMVAVWLWDRYRSTH